MSRNRIAASCLALFLAVGSFAIGDEPAAPTVVRTYAVADLVPRVKSGARPDLAGFAAFIAREAGISQASVIPFHLSLSLIVRGTEAEHAALESRFKFLRAYEQMKSGKHEVEERVDR